jgi:hypothetical protein
MTTDLQSQLKGPCGVDRTAVKAATTVANFSIIMDATAWLAIDTGVGTR